MKAPRRAAPVLVLDVDRCTGCSACRLACGIESALPPGLAWRRVHTFNPERDPRAGVHHLSLACNHCRNAPCRRACPTAALAPDPVTGTLQLDAGRCVGCGMCTWVCPYGAPILDPVRRVMTKCTLCRPRLLQGLDPACIEACPLGSLSLDRSDELAFEEPTLAGLPVVGAMPSLRIRPRRHGAQAPPMSPLPGLELPALPAPDPRESFSLISGLRHEWSLLVFTSLASWMVAWLLARMVAPLPHDHPGTVAAALGFLAAGLLAMALSSLHLARPMRALQAVRNLRRSWISREIVLFGAFTALGGAFLVLGMPPPVGWAAVVAGIGSMISVDMVYRCRGQAVAALPHSAMVTLTVPLLAAVLLDLPLVAAVVLALKLTLYLRRKLIYRGTRAVAGTITSSARLAITAAAGIAWLALRSHASPLAPATVLARVPAIVVAILLAGELLDRAELYAELRFLDPPLQLARDLRRVLLS